MIPIFIAAIADGKVYAFNNEHSPNSPLYKGYSIYCLNATTGEEIYKMLSWSGQTGGQGLQHSNPSRRNTSLLQLLRQPNLRYRKRSKPNHSDSFTESLRHYGDKVLVEGTVIDISAGTQQNEQAARFPAGVPAVSDASQAAWMEYVYMKQEKPTNATGVSVIVSVVDPNGNYYNCRHNHK